jgi:hypothetical protein
MAISPEKNTISTNHVQSLGASIKALEKISEEASKKNKDDANAKELHTRLERLKHDVAQLKPATTQMSVYEGVRDKIKKALTDFPKLAKLVKGVEAPKVKVTVSYANSKVESACKGNHDCAARIDEVANHGPGYLGHKAVNAIKAQGHVHVGNSHGIAFNWSGNTLKIVGYGTKNNGAKAGMSGYDWVL